MSTIHLDLTTVRPVIVLRWNQVKQTITEWRRRMRSRHELASLDEISLQEIGMSQSTAEYEASKPFWIP